MCHIFKQRGEKLCWTHEMSADITKVHHVRNGETELEQEHRICLRYWLLSVLLKLKSWVAAQVFESSMHHQWETLPKPSRHRSSSENKELDNVTFDRQRITRCKNCKVPVGRKKAKQCSGRKIPWQLWHVGPIFLLDAHVALLWE